MAFLMNGLCENDVSTEGWLILYSLISQVKGGGRHTVDLKIESAVYFRKVTQLL